MRGQARQLMVEPGAQAHVFEQSADCPPVMDEKVHCNWFLSVCEGMSVILPRLPALCCFILGFHAFIQPIHFPAQRCS